MKTGCFHCVPAEFLQRSRETVSWGGGQEKQEHVRCLHRELIGAGWRVEIATTITPLS